MNLPGMPARSSGYNINKKAAIADKTIAASGQY